MIEIPSNQLLQTREKIVNRAMDRIVPDLLQIGPSVYSAFLEYGMHPEVYSAVDDILKSHFAELDLQFSCTGETFLTWSEGPVVALDFELAFECIAAFFRLYFSHAESRVTFHHISFSGSSADPKTNNQLLARAFDCCTDRSAQAGARK